VAGNIKTYAQWVREKGDCRWETDKAGRKRKKKNPGRLCGGGGMKATTKVEMRPIGFDSGYGFSLLLLFPHVVISLLLSFVYIRLFFYGLQTLLDWNPGLLF
jgi:hypothetical protein